MQVDPSRYRDLPENPHGIHAGCVLLPTDVPIVLGGGTSRDFVREQGGSSETFVFLFGARSVAIEPSGQHLQVLEGVFLNEDGPGFHPTWDLSQLLREVDLGGWTVIPTHTVLSTWAEKIEQRMNLG